MSESSIENLVDSFYTLHVSTDGAQFNKIPHLTSCSAPSEAKVLDDVTATDDNRTVNAPVNFRENGELDFEYVLNPDDETHQALQTAFDEGKELTFQIKYTKAQSESRQFKAIIAELTTNHEDTKKKLRKTGKLTITGDVTKIGG